jgi:hypothetical protein
MKRRSFLQLALALAGVPFLPKVAAKPAPPPLSPHDPFCGVGEIRHLTVPVGTIQPFAGFGAPPGWLPCDGRVVSRSEYPELGEILPFKLPDLNTNVVMHAVPDDSDRPNLCGWHGEPYSVLQYIIKAKP